MAVAQYESGGKNIEHVKLYDEMPDIGGKQFNYTMMTNTQDRKARSPKKTSTVLVIVGVTIGMLALLISVVLLMYFLLPRDRKSAEIDVHTTDHPQTFDESSDQASPATAVVDSSTTEATTLILPAEIDVHTTDHPQTFDESSDQASPATAVVDSLTTEATTLILPDGIAYKFGPRGGLIHYAHHDMEIQNSNRDILAVRFMTKESDAILVSIKSSESQDFIEMELVNGNIFVIYNMGAMDHPIGQLFDKVDDGVYHVVRFIRDGANASLQIDSGPPQFKNPTGPQLTIFNNLTDVYIGGRKDSEGRIVRPFSGTIAGIVFNGTPLLAKAADGDFPVTLEGDVQLLIQENT